MVNRALASRRDRTAIAISIAVHLCVLAVLATLPGASFPAGEPDERALIVSIMHVERHPPPPPLPAVRQSRAAALTVPSTDTPPPVHVAVAVAHAGRELVVATERRYAPPAAPADSKASVAPRITTTARTVALVDTRPTAVTTPTAAPTPAPTATAAQRDDGIGNFSETYPASVEPGARSALLAGMTGSFVVRITVDENGRAISVEFVRAPADTTLREELRSRLLAVRFIPAACNGLRCNGTLELRN